MDLSHEIAKKLISLKKVGRPANVPASNQQRKKITSNNIDNDDQYDDQEEEEEELTCMIEGCGAMGEEVIALLDEASLSDVDKYDDEHHHDGTSSSSERNNFENKKSSSDNVNNNNKNDSDNLIPAVVCRKHFEKLIEEAYYSKSDLKVVKNK